MKASYQINARVSEETVKQFDEIVEMYREQLPIGKVSKSEVLADIIQKSYKQLQSQKQKASNYQAPKNY